MKFTEKKMDTIIEAYKENLAVEFYYDADHLKYRVEPSMFSILRKDNYQYVKIVSYNIDQIVKGDIDGNRILTICCYSGGIDSGKIYFAFGLNEK